MALRLAGGLPVGLYAGGVQPDRTMYGPVADRLCERRPRGCGASTRVLPRRAWSATIGASAMLSSKIVLEDGVRWSVTDVTAKRDVILAGMGWGGLPEHVVADALASRILVRLEVPEFEVRTMELYALRRRDRPHGVVAQALSEALAQSAPASRTRLRRRSRAAP